MKKTVFNVLSLCVVLSILVMSVIGGTSVTAASDAEGFCARPISFPSDDFDKAPVGTTIISNEAGQYAWETTYHDGRSAKDTDDGPKDGDGNPQWIVSTPGDLHTDNSPVSVKVVESPTGLTGDRAYALGSSKLQTAGWAPDARQITYYVKDDVSFAGASGLMFHVKMPKQKADLPNTNQFTLWMIDSTGNWSAVESGSSPVYGLNQKNISAGFVQLLSHGSACVGMNGGEDNDGFEGYIYIPFSSFGTKPSNDANLIQIRFQCRDFGGDLGDFVVSSFMLTTIDPLSVADPTLVTLEGTEQEVNIFTGEAPSNSSTIDGVATAVQLPYLDTYTLNAEFTGDSTVELLSIPANSFSLKVVDNLTAVSDYPLFKFDSLEGKPAITGNTVDNTKSAITVSGFNRHLAGCDAVMFYVKMPTSGGQSTIYCNLRVDGNEWPKVIKDKPFYTLEKGKTKWKKSTAAGPLQLDLPSGFEGWVRVPLKSFEGDLSNATLLEIILRIQDFGGDYGPAYIGSFLVATNDIISKDGIVIDDRKIIQNLFTGAEMKKEDVEPTVDPIEPPVPGDVFIELPVATTDKLVDYPEDSDISDTTVTLHWDPIEGAASYQVDVYETSSGVGGLLFTYRKSVSTNTNSVSIDGLTAEMRYSCVVHALGADNAVLATYDSVSFFMKSAGGQNTDPTTDPTEDSNPSDDSKNEAGSPVTGENNQGLKMFLMFVPFAAALCAVTLRRKRIPMK